MADGSVYESGGRPRAARRREEGGARGVARAPYGLSARSAPPGTPLPARAATPPAAPRAPRAVVLTVLCACAPYTITPSLSFSSHVCSGLLPVS